MAETKRVADLTPGELRSIIQNGVMVGMLGVYALFTVVGIALYLFGYAWTH